ncbi:MAG: hypothetical protein WBA25_17655 [Jannaschia sp.]
MKEVETILDARAEDLRQIDDAIFGDAVGVAQAAGQLREALDAIDTCLGERRFEAAAALGYRDIASAFIFLQRTLGGLQTAEHRKHGLISDVAQKVRCTYEDVEPHVTARLQCAQPKSA